MFSNANGNTQLLDQELIALTNLKLNYIEIYLGFPPFHYFVTFATLSGTSTCFGGH